MDAGYSTKSSGVTLDRYCGSGITSVNMAAATIMAGMEDLVVAGGTEMMSMPGRRGDGEPATMDKGNLRLRAKHPQTHQGICADAIATMEKIDRETLDELGYQSQQRAAHAIANGHFDKSLVAVHHEDGTLALDREEYPRPQTTREALAGLKPAFEVMADVALDDAGTTYRSLIQQQYPEAGHRVRPPCRQFVGRGRWRGGAAAGLAGLCQGAWTQAARPRCRHGQCRRLADADAQRAGTGRAQGAG